MHPTTDTSEKGLQKLILQYLIEEQGYQQSYSKDFDKEFCINTLQLWSFIEATQPTAFATIQKKGKRNFLARLDRKIHQKGIVETLRKGLKFFDKVVRLFYPEPMSRLNPKRITQYKANIFGITEELQYASNNLNRLDLALFMNGLPIVTMELKNEFTGQNVQDAIRQYQETRSGKLFNFARCLNHFAVDTNWVYMLPLVKGKNSVVLPFNKGLNDGTPITPFGAGNPLNPNGIKTSYLWEQVCTKSSLGNIIQKFAQIVEEKDEDTKKVKKKFIFPRYHQLTAVRQLLHHTKNYGVGFRYLIQHSAGSGKSYSITWLAYQLSNLYAAAQDKPLFDSVIVVTDRTNLDRQIRNNIKNFEQVKNYVAAITGKGDTKTGQLKAALIERKKIIIVTIQTFPWLLKEMSDLGDAHFAIVMDEAHSSQSGETAAQMNASLANKNTDDLPRDEFGKILTEDLLNHIIESRRLLTSVSYFAFTATPKNKTLELFGTKNDEDGKFYPFHTYSMKQAIEEGFILDVLQNYTTYHSYYKLIKSVGDNPSYDTKKAHKKLRAYVEGHEYTIKEKAKVMIDHFDREVKKRIRNQAKAMVVTRSIESAMKYKDAFDEYLSKKNPSFKAIVAFSGKKAHYKTGEELTEEKMNHFADKDNNIPRQFKKSPYRFLIVADKYQTGFDEPLLHTMYVDKKLANVQAVQTLSRLNRAYKPHKKDTFVLDFFNTTEEIKEAFEPYYTTTVLSEETDINRLHDLKDELDNYQIYTEAEVRHLFELLHKEDNRKMVDALIDRSAAAFKIELNQDQQISCKSQAKSFLRTYNYLSKIVDFKEPEWELLWWYLKYLTPKLVVEADDPDENVLEAVNMESYRVTKETTVDLVLESGMGEIEPSPVGGGGSSRNPEYDFLEVILSDFNKRFGNILWKNKDRVLQILTEQIPQQLQADEDLLNIIEVSDKQQAKMSFEKKLERLIKALMFSQTEIYKKYMSDPDFKRQYSEWGFDVMWEKRNRDGV